MTATVTPKVHTKYTEQILMTDTVSPKVHIKCTGYIKLKTSQTVYSDSAHLLTENIFHQTVSL